MEQLFGAIPVALRSLGANAVIDEAVVFAAWKRCAGALLRTRTEPIEFIQNRLAVAVVDETWRRNLVELSPEMLVKLNGSLGQGTVRFIEFRVDKLAVDGAGETQNIALAEDAATDNSPSLINAAEAIADENLRKQFLSAAASYLAKQQRD